MESWSGQQWGTMGNSLILCIGMNKTGTSSLTNALYDLGFPCLHSAKKVKAAVRANQVSGFPPLYPLDQKYMAFCDSPINYMFRELDAAYPGSRFILTIREMEPWIVSRVAQFGNSAEHHEREWQEHIATVSRHFSERQSDLLVYDLCGGDGWSPLCRFLNTPIPEHPFPWKNKTGRKRRERFARTLRRGGQA